MPDLGEAAGVVSAERRYSAQVPDADRRADGVPARLDHAVEQLLRGAGGALQPVHCAPGVEELRRLHDADVRLFDEVRHELMEQVRPGHEVRVEDEDDVVAALLVAVPQVARFLEVAAVRSYRVRKAGLGGMLRHLGPVSVVEHPHAHVRRATPSGT